jgi:anti-sigma B factor antagonist
MSFSVESSEEGPAKVLTVTGEVEFSVITGFTTALTDAAGATDGALVIDLSNVRYIDSSGLGAIIRTQKLMIERDRYLGIVAPSGLVRRVFEISGLLTVLNIHPDLDSALAAASKFSP